MIAGRPRVELWLASDRPDTDVTVFLAHLDHAGRPILLGDGVLRLRFRESTAREVPLVAGEVYRVEVELQNLAVTFTRGDRVRLLISSSNYPRFAKNLNDGGAMYREGAGVVATNEVWGGGDRPSALVLPVL
jgi:putative CocE/NonD family hydrolase